MGERESDSWEDRVRESERALSIYSLCARRGERLLFESTLGAYDFVLQYTGCRSKDGETETCLTNDIPCGW